jgi:hypothetical protein
VERDVLLRDALAFHAWRLPVRRRGRQDGDLARLVAREHRAEREVQIAESGLGGMLVVPVAARIARLPCALRGEEIVEMPDRVSKCDLLRDEQQEQAEDLQKSTLHRRVGARGIIREVYSTA